MASPRKSDAANGTSGAKPATKKTGSVTRSTKSTQVVNRQSGEAAKPRRTSEEVTKSMMNKVMERPGGPEEAAAVVFGAILNQRGGGRVTEAMMTTMLKYPAALKNALAFMYEHPGAREIMVDILADIIRDAENEAAVRNANDITDFVKESAKNLELQEQHEYELEHRERELENERRRVEQIKAQAVNRAVLELEAAEKLEAERLKVEQYTAWRAEEIRKGVEREAELGLTVEQAKASFDFIDDIRDDIHLHYQAPKQPSPTAVMLTARVERVFNFVERTVKSRA